MSNDQVQVAETQASETLAVDNNIYQYQINYRSGHSITAWFDKMTVTHESGKIVGAEWRMAAGEPRFVIIGIHDIESILQLAVVEKPVDTITG